MKKPRSQSDPDLNPPRNSHMEMLGVEISSAQPLDTGTHEAAPSRGKGKVLCDQTKQLIAVRDHRDRAAFGLLFDYYAPRLKAFVMRAGASSAQAEEIVQDVMLKVWRKASMFDAHRASASAWIYQIARNRQIDVFRKESRPIPDELAEDPGAEPDASQMLGVSQEAERLRDAIGRLKPDQRDVIERAYLGDLTHHEISDQTGLPLGTVKSRIRLGLERLRKELKGLR